jgi:hypothetical protein
MLDTTRQKVPKLSVLVSPKTHSFCFRLFLFFQLIIEVHNSTAKSATFSAPTVKVLLDYVTNL